MSSQPGVNSNPPTTSINEILRQYFVWVYEAGAQDRGDLPELTNQFKTALYTLIADNLPLERVVANPDDHEQGWAKSEAQPFNDCLTEVTQILKELFDEN